MTTNIIELKSKLLTEFSKKHNLDLFILFGSRAKNKAKKTSDFDFAFLGRNISTKQEILMFEDLMKILRYEKIDLVNLSKNHDVKVRNEIFSKGICIYESQKGLFTILKGKAWIDYIDFQKFTKNRFQILKNDITKLEV